MVQKFFDDIFDIERKQSLDIRKLIWKIVEKYLKKFSGQKIQQIYIDIVLVYFGFVNGCISFTSDMRDIVPMLCAELQMKIPRFRYIYDKKFLEYIPDIFPVIVFNSKKESSVRSHLKDLRNEKDRNLCEKIINKILGLSDDCITPSEENEFGVYKIAFNFVYNSESKTGKPENIKTKHLECTSEELSAFAMNSLLRKLKKLQAVFYNFSKYSFEPSLSNSGSESLYSSNSGSLYSSKSRLSGKKSIGSSSMKHSPKNIHHKNKHSGGLCEYTIRLEISLKDHFDKKRIEVLENKRYSFQR